MKIIRDLVIAILLGAFAFVLFVAVKRGDETTAPHAGDDVVVQDEEDGGGTVDVIPAQTGLSGQVLVGPQCPVVHLDEECPDAPYNGVVDVLVDDPERELIARVHTDATGAFITSVPAGAYVVLVPTDASLLPACPESHVDIQEGEMSTLVIRCDSGIR